jgi:hypothetical protein
MPSSAGVFGVEAEGEREDEERQGMSAKGLRLLLATCFFPTHGHHGSIDRRSINAFNEPQK